MFSRSTKLKVKKTFGNLKRVIMLIVAIVLLVIFVIAQNNFIVTKQYVFQSDKIPKTFVGYKIVHISDIMNDPGTLAITVANSKPDFVVISGNLSSPDGKYNNSVNLIKSLSSKYNTVYTLGEYDVNYADGIKSELDTKTSALCLEDMNIDINSPTVDEDEFISKFIGGKYTRLAESGDEDALSYIDYTKASLAEAANSKIVIAGLPVMSAETDFIDKSYNTVNLDRGLFQLLVLNQTQYLDEISKVDIDVTLSGNTFGTDSDRIGYSKGLYSKNGTALFVSGGIGRNPKSGGRILNFPEISVITLSDGTIKDENPLEKLLGYFIDDVKTRFDGDNGFTVYRKDY